MSSLSKGMSPQLLLTAAKVESSCFFAKAALMQMESYGCRMHSVREQEPSRCNHGGSMHQRSIAAVVLRPCQPTGVKFSN